MKSSLIFFLTFVICTLTSCYADKKRGAFNTHLKEVVLPPITTKNTNGGNIRVPFDGTNGGHTDVYCNLSVDEKIKFIDKLDSLLTQNFDRHRARIFCDSLRLHIYDTNFFSEPVMTNRVESRFKSVNEELNWGLSQLPPKATRKDSAAVIVNYVFTHYNYGGGSYLDPKNFYHGSMETIGKEINANRLAGSCGDIAYFLGLIISEKFPWWGFGVSLSSLSKGTVGHTFWGLADTSGYVYIVIDPIINVIWTDANSNLINLNEIQRRLLTNSETIRGFSNTIFGRKQKQFHDTQCVMYPEFRLGTATATRDSLTGFYSITADWYGLNDTSCLLYQSLVKPYWEYRKFPQNTWANHCLMIENTSCSIPVIADKVLERYKMR